MNNIYLISDITRKELKDNNFDFLRYFFAFSVLFIHYSELTNTSIFWPIPSLTAVRGFLTMSGFMVCLSFINNPDTLVFLKKRVYRIYPPYLFIVIICVIGALILSNLPAIELLKSKEFYKYIISNLTFLNFLQPTLPGLFENNHIQAVNGSLWTMKVEFFLYLTVPIVFLLFHKFNKAFILIGIYIFSFIYSACMDHYYSITGKEIYNILDRQFIGQLRYFYSGTLLLLYFDFFNKYILYLFPLAILVYILGFLPYMEFLEPLAFASILVGFAYSFKFLNFLSRYTNVSYGIYLFHFPVIQTMIHFNLHVEHYYLSLLLAIVITILLSIISWKLIEKHFLKKKAKLQFTNKSYQQKNSAIRNETI